MTSIIRAAMGVEYLHDAEENGKIPGCDSFERPDSEGLAERGQDRPKPMPVIPDRISSFAILPSLVTSPQNLD